ncbi:MAG: flagellar motor switch protein FliN [Acidobacteria bacterium]|nr:flagellar motor switch protein FliN [Acidobacteriota bacterium]
MSELATQNELISWLRIRFEEKLADVIDSMTGERPAIKAVESTEPLERLETSVAWWTPLSLGPEAGLATVFPIETWRAIGQSALVAVGIEDGDDDSIRGTFLEIQSQALTSVLWDLGQRAKVEITMESGRALEPTDTFDFQRYQLGDGSPFELGVSSALIDQVIALAYEADRPRDAKAAAAAAGNGLSMSRSDSGDGMGSSGASTLDLLLDVELPVSVSFGRAQVPLKDVLKLTSGSIVELNRTVAEPVEIIVNNCVIARGEVVVVEGNYGIRIQEIISRAERLRTLN